MTKMHTALRKLAEAATPGPWYDTNGAVWIDTRTQVCCGRGYEECCGNPDVDGGQEHLADSNPTDAAFIAAANPSTVLALLKENEELRKALEELVDAVIPEVNEKGAGGNLLARLTDARTALKDRT